MLIRQMLPCCLVYVLLATSSVVTVASVDTNDEDAAASSRRHLQVSDTTEITDATSSYVGSSESIFDHEVNLKDNLSFHWNDITGDHFNGRLIYKADSVAQAPSWLGVGLYHSNHNYTVIPISNFMIGSDAIIGLTRQEEFESSGLEAVQLYNLGGKQSPSQITPHGGGAGAVDSTNSIVQHDSDDGSVVTELTFRIVANSLEGAKIRTDGTNIFLWAIGPPGPAGVLNKHFRKGVIYLDFQSVADVIREGVTDAPPPAAPVAAGPANSQPITPMTNPPTAPPTIVNSSPVISGTCNSNIFGDQAAQVALTPSLTFHWKLISTNQVQMALEYMGPEAWLGLASSASGKMIGSTAVIGVPGTDVKAQVPTQYKLTAQLLSGIQIDDNGSFDLKDADITSERTDGSRSSDYRTVMTFTKILNDPNDDVPITKDGLNTLLYAAGPSRTLGYHEHRGSFRLDLNDCDGNVLIDVNAQGDESGKKWTNRATFAAHGFFAFLAWGLASPLAVSAAWFRTLIPTSWIYIHVFFNASTFMVTFLAFWIAVGGVAASDETDHFSKLHHFMGLILMVLVTVQVLNGFLRPPVERKDRSVAPAPVDDDDTSKDLLCGCLAIPDTPRETWQLIHRSSGLTAIVLGIYQISSGLGLYADRFGTNSLVKYFFIYVGLFLVGLVGLKLYSSRQEDNARRGVVQPVNTSDPEGDDEEHMATRATYS